MFLHESDLNTVDRIKEAKVLEHPFATAHNGDGLCVTTIAYDHVKIFKKSKFVISKPR